MVLDAVTCGELLDSPSLGCSSVSCSAMARDTAPNQRSAELGMPAPTIKCVGNLVVARRHARVDQPHSMAIMESTVRQTSLSDVLVVEHEVFEDERGFFKRCIAPTSSPRTASACRARSCSSTTVAVCAA